MNENIEELLKRLINSQTETNKTMTEFIELVNKRLNNIENKFNNEFLTEVKISSEFNEKNKMCKCIEFGHSKFGEMEVIIDEDEQEIYFSDNFLKKCLDVKNEQLPNCCATYSKDDNWVNLFEIFEYIKYAKVDKDTRNSFEEWIADVIKDCSKLL